MASIDLATHFLSKGHKVFVLHPGKKKKFYLDFIEQDKVFLDLPGIRLPRVVDTSNLETLALLRMGRQISSWYGAGCPKKRTPSRNVEDYWPQRKSRARYVSEAEGLYSKAKRGDLVVCPGPGYLSEVYIGQLMDDFNPRVVAHARVYDDEPIPARRVTWLAKGQRKIDYSWRLIELMQNRQALIQVTVPVEKTEIYATAYKDYALEDLSVGRILITNPSIDLHELNNRSEIISYFAAMFAAQDDGNLHDFLSLPYLKAIEQFYDREYIVNTSIEVRSPGQITVKARTLVLPAFLGVMLVLSASSLNKDEAAAIDLTNSAVSTSEASVSDECMANVKVRVESALNMMGYERWKEICEERRKAREDVGLESPMPLKGADSDLLLFRHSPEE